MEKYLTLFCSHTHSPDKLTIKWNTSETIFPTSRRLMDLGLCRSTNSFRICEFPDHGCKNLRDKPLVTAVAALSLVTGCATTNTWDYPVQAGSLNMAIVRGDIQSENFTKRHANLAMYHTSLTAGSNTSGP